LVSNETTTSTEQGAAQRNTALALNGAPTTDENFVPQALTLPSLDLPLFRAAPPQDYARPAYAEQFACIGAACEDNCCKGWSVPIDRVTYEKYSSVPGLKQHIGTLVVLNTNHPTPADYARIPLTAQSECGFLNPEKLCGIQKEHGHAMLSSTCATYPRAVTTNAGIVEKALNFSCPEAARVTLLNPHLLGQGVWKTHGPRRYDAVTRRRPAPSPATQRLTNDPSRARTVLAFEPQLAVREFALLLLGDRRYPLWQRLYLLGNFAWRLQSACEASGCLSIADWCEAHPDQVLNHLHQSARRVATESARPVMDDIAFEPDQQIKLVLEMVRIRFQQPPVPLRFLECVRDFQLGLGTATARNEQEILAAYSTSYRQYYAPSCSADPTSWKITSPTSSSKTTTPSAKILRRMLRTILRAICQVGPLHEHAAPKANTSPSAFKSPWRKPSSSAWPVTTATHSTPPTS